MLLYFRMILLLICSCNFLAAQEAHSLAFWPETDSLDFAHESAYQTSHTPAIKNGDNIHHFEPVLSAECEPLTTVANCVNVLSGQFFQIEKDLHDNGIEPLSLVRYYDSGNQHESFLGFGFGSQFPLWACEMEDTLKHCHVLISEREGFMLPYKGRLSSSEKVCSIDPRLMDKGYTNLSRAAVSGHANFINWQATCRTHNLLSRYWQMQLGDGSKRFYTKALKLEKDLQRRLRLPTRYAYLLTEEIKPNGNRLRFAYQMLHGKPRLVQVRAFNRTGQTILNELTFNYSSSGCTLFNCGGAHVEYVQAKDFCIFTLGPLPEALERKALKQVHSSQKGKTTYQARKNQGHRKIVQVKKPQGSFVEVEYDLEGKVAALREPLGPHGETLTSYRFNYQKDFTMVTDALNHVKFYCFDSNQRLCRIQHMLPHRHIARQESFEWSTSEGQKGWLRSKSLHKGDHLFHLKSYRYDSRGNIIRETFYGNLTGEKPESFTLADKHLTDHYKIDYRYSDDARNLVIQKTGPQGQTINYAYLPQTNLCTKILSSYAGKIQARIFHTYDENGQISQTSEDDGCAEHESDLTDIIFRRVKMIQAVTTPGSSFGKPQEERQFCLDQATRQMLLLKKIQYSYDAQGYEIKQRVYNSQEAFCYETTKVYDSRGCLLQASNPLGQTTVYVYDAHSHKIEEELIGSGKRVFYAYDAAQRLIQKEERHQNGEIFITTYFYNALNQLLAEIDAYGHETTYRYDALGRQIECIKPVVQNAQGQSMRPILKREYNALDQVISQTDERGLTTYTTYNVYGSPTQVTYPDGAIERFIYYPAGWLKQKWQADGTSISYVYNPQGQVIKESTLDPQGALLKEEERSYKGALLQSKKDAMGLITTFHYDGAGRKIEETNSGGKTLRYTYDDFGRLIQVFRVWQGQAGQIEVYTYDWLDRLTSKTLQDHQGHVYAQETYDYDNQGNQIQKAVTCTANSLAIDRSYYGSDGNLVWQEDALGHRTTWLYNYQHVNGLSQKVQSRVRIDALGQRIHEADDALHRLVRRDVVCNEQQYACTHYDYDATDWLVRQHVAIKVNGEALREYVVGFNYNNRGLLESEVEMDHKTTCYFYDRMKRVVKKIKPDGTALNYRYDALGRLEEMTSSDGTVAYTYTYDLHDNPLEIRDLVHQITQKRTYDLCHRLIEEELSSGITLQYTYDALDRVTRLTLPDRSFVTYLYDCFHLQTLQRFEPSGQLTYTYACQAYDQKGNLLTSLSPAGVTHYTYDLLGRTVAIQAPTFESSLEQFDALGNLLKMRQTDPNGECESHFAYDRFNHLSTEQAAEALHYVYDSLGNCLRKNHQLLEINDLNQVLHDGESAYTYDPNGNLTQQTNPAISYTYDALNRLIAHENQGKPTILIYDAFNRCIQVQDEAGIKHLLYQKNQEIGSCMQGQLHELRLIHPHKQPEFTLAIELQKELFFPLQDARGNICAMQNPSGHLATWYRYSAFGDKTLYGEEALHNPWGFANKREIAGLALFNHRLYHPQLRRWLTADPLGFEDGLNLYAYVHNHPFYFQDLDGQFALVMPLLQFSFGVALGPLIGPSLLVIGSALIAYQAYELCTYLDHRYNQIEQNENIETKEEKKGKRKGKDNEIKGGPPRDQNTGDYLPDLAAKGSSHTTLGIKVGSNGHPYTQGATFDEKGDFKGRTDMTNHGRRDHPSPHYHPAIGPNSVKPGPYALPDIN